MSQQAFPTIYLVRHATPDWSRTDIPYHIPPGPPLTAQGEAEAAKLGDFLRDMQASQILCSPLARCLRTAEIAAETAGIPHAIDNRLAEVLPQEKPADVLARIWPAWVHVGELCLQAGPVVLLRSRMVTTLELVFCSISAWRREADSSTMTISQSGLRPRVTMPAGRMNSRGSCQGERMFRIHM